MNKYYLKTSWQKDWVEVTKEEWIRAERGAGFRPKLPSNHPNYYKVCATASFGTENIQGKIEYDTNK